jgi:hypothetical protein
MTRTYHEHIAGYRYRVDRMCGMCVGRYGLLGPDFHRLDRASFLAH